MAVSVAAEKRDGERPQESDAEETALTMLNWQVITFVVAVIDALRMNVIHEGYS